MIFSEKLQLIRKSKGFTQEELAEKLSVSRQAVAKWEAGQVYDYYHAWKPLLSRLGAIEFSL